MILWSIFRNAYSWGAAFDQQLFLQQHGHAWPQSRPDRLLHPCERSDEGALTQGATTVTNLQDFTLRWQLIGNW